MSQPDRFMPASANGDDERERGTDPDGMLDAVRGLPGQIEAAWARVQGLELPDSHRAPAAVVVAGMGGSAIAADVAVSALAKALRIPIVVHRDSDLPGWVDQRTLVIASSFSGNTSETLSAWDNAGDRGCTRIALTAGGALQVRARNSGSPLVTLIPGGQPRAAFGQSFACVLGVFRAAGVIDDPSQAIAEATKAMLALIVADSIADESGGLTSEDPNLPCAVAKELEGRLPLIFAPPGLESVGRRWRGQFNENAKLGAILETLPEAHHNAVEGLPGLLRLGIRPIGLLLQASQRGSAGAHSIDATETLLSELAIPLLRVAAPELPGNELLHQLWLVQHADLTSVRLALATGLDPSPIPTIQRLKLWLESNPGNP